MDVQLPRWSRRAPTPALPRAPSVIPRAATGDQPGSTVRGEHLDVKEATHDGRFLYCAPVGGGPG